MIYGSNFGKVKNGHDFQKKERPPFFQFRLENQPVTYNTK